MTNCMMSKNVLVSNAAGLDDRELDGLLRLRRERMALGQKIECLEARCRVKATAIKVPRMLPGWYIG